MRLPKWSQIGRQPTFAAGPFQRWFQPSLHRRRKDPRRGSSSATLGICLDCTFTFQEGFTLERYEMKISGTVCAVKVIPLIFVKPNPVVQLGAIVEHLH